ncbi:MAG: TonB-dependent receptor plug domain-containing protein [Bacteroidota bacterium]
MSAQLTITMVLLSLLLSGGCKSSEPAAETTMEQVVEEHAKMADQARPKLRIDPNRPLIDHLRQFPSLQIMTRASGYNVRLRGPQSIAQSDYVLFVINSTPVGQSYDYAESMINMYNVEKIDVLTPRFAQQRYGERGMFGAVVITTTD